MAKIAAQIGSIKALSWSIAELIVCCIFSSSRRPSWLHQLPHASRISAASHGRNLELPVPVLAVFFEFVASAMASPTSSGWLDFGRHGRDSQLPRPSMAVILEVVTHLLSSTFFPFSYFSCLSLLRMLPPLQETT
jgi:hypothetical protein